VFMKFKLKGTWQWALSMIWQQAQLDDNTTITVTHPTFIPKNLALRIKSTQLYQFRTYPMPEQYFEYGMRRRSCDTLLPTIRSLNPI
jgi:hypothetical protein